VNTSNARCRQAPVLHDLRLGPVRHPVPGFPLVARAASVRMRMDSRASRATRVIASSCSLGQACVRTAGCAGTPYASSPPLRGRAGQKRARNPPARIEHGAVCFGCGSSPLVDPAIAEMLSYLSPFGYRIHLEVQGGKPDARRDMRSGAYADWIVRGLCKASRELGVWHHACTMIATSSIRKCTLIETKESVC